MPENYDNLFRTRLSREELDTAIESIMERLEMNDTGARCEVVAEYELLHLFD